MRVNLFIESDISVFDFDAIKVGELVSEKFEQITKCPYDTCCDITVVDDAEMAQILFRAENGIGKDKYLIAKRLGVSAKQLQETLRSIANSHA